MRKNLIKRKIEILQDTRDEQQERITMKESGKFEHPLANTLKDQKQISQERQELSSTFQNHPYFSKIGQNSE